MKLATGLIVMMLAGVAFNIYLAEQQCMKDKGVFSVLDGCRTSD